MKKHLFIAFAAAGLLASCSSNDDDFNAPGGNQTGINENDPVEILLGVGTQASVATRGTGSVGATHNSISTNNWANQVVNVFMFNRGTFKFATDGANAIYNDAAFLTPASGSTGVARHIDDETGSEYAYGTDGYKRSYYPMNGNFSFWAYRVDDANGAQVTKVITPGSTTYAMSQSEGYVAVDNNGAVYVGASTLPSDLGNQGNWKSKEDLVNDEITSNYVPVYVNKDNPSDWSTSQGDPYNEQAKKGGQLAYVSAPVGSPITEGDLKNADDIWSSIESNYAQLYVKVVDPKVDKITYSPATTNKAVVTSTFENGSETGKITVPFTINGSQDILAASTYLTRQDTMNLAKNNTLSIVDNHLQLTTDDKKIYDSYAQSLYSAKTARQSVQPNLLFKHMLTRFTFNAAAMQDNFAESGDDEVRIKAIKLYSRTSGKLIATYTKDANNVKGQDSVIVCTLDTSSVDQLSNPKVALSLMKRASSTASESDNLVELTQGTQGVGSPATEGIALVSKSATEWTALGEALLVMPDEEEYEMDITLEQTVYGREDVNGVGVDGTQEVKEATIKGLKIKAADVLKGAHAAVTDGENAGIQKFAAGHSYNVRVQVYGLSKIEVKTTLEPWVDGGHVDIDPDNQF